MNRDIINLINSQIVKDYEDQIAYYKALANTYKAISDAKGKIGARYSPEYIEERLILYVLSLEDGYNKRYNNVLSEIEEIVDNVVEKWKYHECHMDKVAKYERVMF